jgi:hypothetical protein
MIPIYIVALGDEGLHRGGVLGVPHFSPKYLHRIPLPRKLKSYYVCG